jgi:hypothetical protein
VPELQVVQEVAPEFEYVPAAQSVQLAAPLEEEYFPAEQEVQLVAPVEEYVPAQQD